MSYKLYGIHEDPLTGKIVKFTHHCGINPTQQGIKIAVNKSSLDNKTKILKEKPLCLAKKKKIKQIKDEIHIIKCHSSQQLRNNAKTNPTAYQKRKAWNTEQARRVRLALLKASLHSLEQQQ